MLRLSMLILSNRIDNNLRYCYFTFFISFYIYFLYPCFYNNVNIYIDANSSLT
ncbi:hypothetical protein TRABTM_A_00230 [secondary endosymbiont of Trabutina mannipara]|uniref:Uncharacterized protein n=1 Tax=secondary endosymbiont of Trabutina mannipara TaxID=1835721 RepID=A0A1C3L3Q6_9ENTR|nr:hypothetical protein TRABTM_A_00230 [secondary endosymbiont of Trabutina mannipara]